ncbi:Pentatricopeptide repeat-containing protein, chloroplastic [Symbiodinium microadriaticum]|uniref:Pentatricopeptide repeat-containing protein, chloroplastic n=1 Tax=Symbiodinium microadriaticum TaxID=2951 RepID=A0A1Q9EF41_SYMMI|nr:Pentatricopeptide repeat-containing protein, chloroplastic [Symbiodinium microadriaticum]
MQRRAFSAPGRVPRAAQVAQQLLKMCPEPARRLLREELRSWKRPSRDALPMLKELRATKRVDLVCELLNLLKAEPRAKPGLLHFTEGISACARATWWSQAVAFFHDLPDAAVLPDIVCCNATLSSCAKGGQWPLAVDLLKSMPTAQLSPNAISYNSTITACEKAGKWQQAVLLFSALPRAKLAPTIVTFGSVVSACEKGGHWQMALQIFHSIPGFSAAISACEKSGAWQKALQLFNAMPETDVEPNTISYSAAISACEKGGQWQLALHLFDTMPKVKLQSTISCYSAALSACEQGAAWELALQLLGSLSRDGLRGDTILYGAALSSLEKAGQWQLSWHLLFRLPQLRLDPDIIAYNAALGACRRAGRWQLILELFAAMPAMELFPNLLSFHSVLDCTQNSSVDRAEVAQAVSRRIQDLGKMPMSGASTMGVLYIKAQMTVQWWISEHLHPLRSRRILSSLQRKGGIQDAFQSRLQLELNRQHFNASILANQICDGKSGKTKKGGKIYPELAILGLLLGCDAKEAKSSQNAIKTLASGGATTSPRLWQDQDARPAVTNATTPQAVKSLLKESHERLTGMLRPKRDDRDKAEVWRESGILRSLAAKAKTISGELLHLALGMVLGTPAGGDTADVNTSHLLLVRSEKVASLARRICDGVRPLATAELRLAALDVDPGFWASGVFVVLRTLITHKSPTAVLLKVVQQANSKRGARHKNDDA